MKHLFIAGFDFGTSYSKVVLRDQLTGLAKAVTFGPGKLGLLPSYLRVHENNLYGPLDEGPGDIISYPKLLAADAAEGQERFRTVYSGVFESFQRSVGIASSTDAAGILLIRYFFAVICGIREFIATDCDWSDSVPAADPLMIQLAVPSGLMAQRDGPLETLMRNALRAAHLLAHRNQELPSLIDLLDVHNEIGKLTRPILEMLDKCCVIYPEVAAGVQAVLRSRNIPDGKFITMDVGAGTVDLNAFYRNSTGLDYWSCEVVPLGFARLKVGASAVPGCGHDVTVDPLEEEPLMSEVRKAVAKLMGQAFRYQPKKIVGTGTPPWQHDTHAYIWGGGSGFTPYESNYLKALHDCDVGVTEFANRLPVPNDNFVLPSDVGDFGRLAVAFGLSFHHANLDAVRLPSQLQTFGERYPDYWQLSRRTAGTCTCHANPACFKCGGTGFIKADEDLVPNWTAITRAWNAPPPSNGQSEYRGQYFQALQACLNGFYRQGARIAEKVDFLNQIQLLMKRPELPSTLGLVQEGQSLLLHNVTLLGGVVSVVQGSAVLTSGGCKAVISLRKNQHMEAELFGSNPVRIAQLVNNSPESLHIPFGCAVKKNEKGRFQLLINKLPDQFECRN